MGAKPAQKAGLASMPPLLAVMVVGVVDVVLVAMLILG